MSLENTNLLSLKLKEELIQACAIKHVKAQELTDEESIFGPEGQLELDSLDALELVMILEQNFGIKLNDKKASRKVFESFKSLTEYVESNSPKEKLETFLSSQVFHSMKMSKEE